MRALRVRSVPLWCRKLATDLSKVWEKRYVNRVTCSSNLIFVVSGPIRIASSWSTWFHDTRKSTIFFVHFPLFYVRYKLWCFSIVHRVSKSSHQRAVTARYSNDLGHENLWWRNEPKVIRRSCCYISSILP